jgi:putative PIN family toxin of toxin-antitoxin system
MKVVLDTNVVMSGLFWSGPPEQILRLWSEGNFTLLLSTAIYEEYLEVHLRLSARHSLPSAHSALQSLFLGSHMVEPQSIQTPPCDDPKDVKFLELAVAGGARYLVSGDKHLLKVGQYDCGHVLRPKEFLTRF